MACIYIQTDQQGNPIRIGKASQGLEARYRGGTGYAIDAAMHSSNNLVFVAAVPKSYAKHKKRGRESLFLQEPFRGVWRAEPRSFVSRLRRYLIAKVGLLALLLVLGDLAGCQVEDIIIDVSTKGREVVIRVHYDGSSDPVGLTEVLVQESKNGPIIWDVKTYDPTTFSDQRYTKFDLDELKKNPIKMLTLSEMVFSVVPDGFNQCVPKPGIQPLLEAGKSYDIFVRGAGHLGRGHFTL